MVSLSVSVSLSLCMCALPSTPLGVASAALLDTSTASCGGAGVALYRTALSGKIYARA